MMWIGVIIVLVAIVGAFALSTVDSLSASRQGSTVDFALNDFAGKSIHLSDYRGQPVLVNLWASWCPPCRAEMPDLIRYYNVHHADGLVLLAVNSEDNSNSAQQFASQQQMPFPVLFDPNGNAERVFGANGLPSTFLVDRAGNLRFSWTGQISPSILEQRVTPLLTQ
jgi:cytochrome c biogenesis protein CcmG/thiol:disulfide interchange protein DsbE